MKTVATKLVAMGLAVSAILTGVVLTGCNLNRTVELETYVNERGEIIVIDGVVSYVSGGPDDPNVKDPTTGKTDINKPGTTTKEPDSTTKEPLPPFIPTADLNIDEENITAEAVLENLEEFTYDLACMFFFTGCDAADNYNTKTQFISFSPKIIYSSDENRENIISVPFKNVFPEHSWLTFESSPYYNDNIDTLKSAYNISLKYNINSFIHNNQNSTLSGLRVPAEEYEAVLKAFGLEKYQLTYEKIHETPEYVDYLRQFKDQYVYPAITLDKATIKNATPEQLIAINNMLKSMYNINMFGTIDAPAN